MNWKEVICKIVMEVLFRALRVLAKVDSRIDRELRKRSNGEVIRIATGKKKSSPALSFEIVDGSFEKTEKQPDIEIIFRNDTAALKVFVGLMGIDRAYAAHAFSLRGNINAAMGIVRMIDIVEGYLFPKFYAGRILKGEIRREYPMLLVYLRALLFAA